MQADRTTTTVMPVVALQPKVLGITNCHISCCVAQGVLQREGYVECSRKQKQDEMKSCSLGLQFGCRGSLSLRAQLTSQTNQPTSTSERGRRTNICTNEQTAGSLAHRDAQRHTATHRETQGNTETHRDIHTHTETHTNTDALTHKHRHRHRPRPRPRPRHRHRPRPRPRHRHRHRHTNTHTALSDSLRLTQTHSDSLSHSLHHSHTLSLSFPLLSWRDVQRCVRVVDEARP